MVPLGLAVMLLCVGAAGAGVVGLVVSAERGFVLV